MIAELPISKRRASSRCASIFRPEVRVDFDSLQNFSTRVASMVQPSELNYQLQACRNLEREFTQRGDRESARYFQQRIRQIEKQNQKIGGAK